MSELNSDQKHACIRELIRSDPDGLADYLLRQDKQIEALEKTYKTLEQYMPVIQKFGTEDWSKIDWHNCKKFDFHATNCLQRKCGDCPHNPFKKEQDPTVDIPIPEDDRLKTFPNDKGVYNCYKCYQWIIEEFLADLEEILEDDDIERGSKVPLRIKTFRRNIIDKIKKWREELKE